MAGAEVTRFRRSIKVWGNVQKEKEFRTAARPSRGCPLFATLNCVVCSSIRRNYAHFATLFRVRSFLKIAHRVEPPPAQASGLNISVNSGSGSVLLPLYDWKLWVTILVVNGPQTCFIPPQVPGAFKGKEVAPKKSKKIKKKWPNRGSRIGIFSPNGLHLAHLAVDERVDFENTPPLDVVLRVFTISARHSDKREGSWCQPLRI